MKKPKHDMAALMPTIANLVNYDQFTGAMTWKPRDTSKPRSKWWNTRFAGKKCGALNDQGYQQVNYYDPNTGARLSFKAHRIAWFIVHGRLPDGDIDHINQNRSDNRIENLRDVSRSINQRNSSLRSTNRSGVSNVWWNRQEGKWQAGVGVNNKKHYIGLYSDLDEAEKAVKAFREQNGFTANHGRKRPPPPGIVGEKGGA